MPTRKLGYARGVRTCACACRIQELDESVQEKRLGYRLGSQQHGDLVSLTDGPYAVYSALKGTFYRVPKARTNPLAERYHSRGS